MLGVLDSSSDAVELAVDISRVHGAYLQLEIGMVIFEISGFRDSEKPGTLSWVSARKELATSSIGSGSVESG